MRLTWMTTVFGLAARASAYQLSWSTAAAAAPASRRASAARLCDAPVEEKTDAPKIISFSERALAQLETMREKKDSGEIVLRMGVRAGGCSGMSYVMDLIEQEAVDDGDTIVDLAAGMQCAIDAKSLMFLYGMQVCAMISAERPHTSSQGPKLGTLSSVCALAFASGAVFLSPAARLLRRAHRGRLLLPESQR